MRDLTRIHQIEISTRCNLRCKYCPHPGMKRPKEDMSREVFTRSLKWVEYFINKGGQHELAITGIGEAILHPEFFDMMIEARNVYKGFMNLSTNGLYFTEEYARFCYEYQIGVFISLHRPEKAAHAVNLAKQYNILCGMNSSFVDTSMDWAGTVNWYTTAPKAPCKYQRDGWGVILVDGTITTCCMDSEKINSLGHVANDFESVVMQPKPLCSNCHLYF